MIDYIYRTDEMLDTLKAVIQMKNAFRQLNKSKVLDELSPAQKIKLEERLNEIELAINSVGRQCRRVFDHL